MRSCLAAALLVLLSCAGAARAETLDEVLRTHGIALPPGAVPHLDRTVGAHQVLDDARDLLVVYTLGAGQAARIHATRFDRRSRAWKSARLEWRGSALDSNACGGRLTIERFAIGFLVRAHVGPSAQCTIALGHDLAVRGVLAGWPLAKLSGGRVVYQQNPASPGPAHPTVLALFDPLSPDASFALHPREPYQPARREHIARIRVAYTEAWCRARNHPCDPELFDERLVGDVAADAAGDALAFAVQWDNTAGWSDTERWGRLEAFRETRAALAEWDGRGAPPSTLDEGLHAGLARVRTIGREADVLAALDGDSVLRELVGAALASTQPRGQDPRAWLIGLDARWADGEIWRRLGRAVTVPDESTEVIYVYSGLRTPDRLRYREMLRRDFDARFGSISLGRALEPEVLRRIFAAGPG